MKKRLFWVSLLTTILVLAFGSPSLANKPVVEVEPFEDAFAIPCDGFDAEFVNSGTITRKTFFDKDDNPVKLTEHWNLLGTVGNSVTKKSVRDHAAFNVTVNFDQNTVTFTGVRLNLKFPNGVHVIEIGKLVVDPEANEIKYQSNKAFDENAVAKMCEGLASL